MRAVQMFLRGVLLPFRLLFGYDAFISYSRKDGQTYAETLSQSLASNISPRIDLQETAPGAAVPTLIKIAIVWSRTLVLVATPRALTSTHVLEEIRLFRRLGAGSIHVVACTPEMVLETPELRGLPVITESMLCSGDHSRVSDEVVRRIVAAVGFWKRSRRQAFLTASAVAILLLMVYAANTARRDAAAAQTARDTAVLRQITADAAVTHAGDMLRQTNGQLETATTLNEALATTNADLDKRNAALSKEGATLSFTLAARRQLNVDPVAAYRLAQRAYTLDATSENGDLLLGAISRLSWPYQLALPGCELLHVNDPLALLDCTSGHVAKGPVIVDLRTLNVTEADSLSRPWARLINRGGANRWIRPAAWIVPIANAWRILMHEYGTVTLWDASGRQIGSPIETEKAYPIVFCDRSTVMVDSNGWQYVDWDVQQDERKVRHVAQTGPFKPIISGMPAFPDLAFPIGCRNDGVLAMRTVTMLGLVGKDGEPSGGTQLVQDSTPGRGGWSRDGLAVRLERQSGVGIWSPGAKSFVWLDPRGWLGTAAAWGKGHLLLLAGHTEIHADNTIEVVDGLQAQQRHTIAHPASSIVSLHVDESGERFVDGTENGAIEIRRAVDGEIVRSGFHVGVVEVNWSGHVVVSSGANSVRFLKDWQSPTTFWTFRSNTTRHYMDCAAADIDWRWHAAVFLAPKEPQAPQDGSLKMDVPIGIEVRDIRTGETRVLELPTPPFAYCRGLQFSPDGRWLAVLMDRDRIRLWDTQSWREQELPIKPSPGVLGFNFDRSVLRALHSSDQIEFTVDLAAPGYSVATPPLSKVSPMPLCRPNDSVAGYVQGWRSALERTDYLTQDLYSCGGGWIQRVLCRHDRGAYGAGTSCDLEFIPSDIRRVMKLIDPILWKIPESVMQEIVRQDR